MRYFDMFSGLGGFRAGLSMIEGFKCVGHCEIDKFANKSYQALFNTEGEYFCDDARKIKASELPDFDLLCAGFPCQPFSQSGKRLGFNDTRGTMFFEIARVAREKKPDYMLLENVNGLLYHNKGKTFETILNTLYGLGYNVEWQVLNSKDFGVPQSRKRLYAFCYFDENCTGKIFPIRGSNSQTLKQPIGGVQGKRVYNPNGLSTTLTSGGGGKGGRSGLYFIDLSHCSKMTDSGKCITAKCNSGICNRNGKNSSVLVCDEPIPLLTPDRLKLRQNGKRYRIEPNSPMFTLTCRDRHGVLLNGRIRKLMPAECLMLQGFDKEQIAKIISVNSDNQVYKQAGNAVTVSVVYEIGLKLKEALDS